MIRRPPISTLSSSSAASDVYKRQGSYGLITSATEDNEWLYFFTNESEAHSREISGVVTQAPIIEILKAALENESAAGLIINPFGKHFVMEKHVIDITLKAYVEESELYT